MIRSLPFVLGCTALALAAGAASAQNFLNMLTPSSTYVDQCQGPCLCHVAPIIVSGGMQLTYTHSDSLYDYYTATVVDWSLQNRTITGSGVYKRGGEVALAQQLMMDLLVNGVAHHLDSGVVSTNGVAFPNVRITIEDTVHATACNYITLRLDMLGGCGVADVAGLGGSAGPDGQLTADDLVYFLGRFFAGDATVADIAGLGGSPGPDGVITPDDLVAFLTAFFAGC